MQKLTNAVSIIKLEL